MPGNLYRDARIVYLQFRLIGYMVLGMEVSVSNIRKEGIILEALRRVRAGERVTLTRRGKAVAQLVLPKEKK